MARQPASAHTSKAKGSVPKAKGRAGSAQKQARAARASRAQASEEPRLFDERTRRDVTGVAVSVLAVALFAAAVLPSEAVVTSFLSTALHLSLGLGAYVLPFLLLIIGASFLVRFERERVPARVNDRACLPDGVAKRRSLRGDAFFCHRMAIQYGALGDGHLYFPARPQPGKAQRFPWPRFLWQQFFQPQNRFSGQGKRPQNQRAAARLFREHGKPVKQAVAGHKQHLILALCPRLYIFQPAHCGLLTIDRKIAPAGPGRFF